MSQMFACRHWKTIALLLLCTLHAGATPAQEDARRTLRIIVPLTAGGPVDNGARLIAPQLEARLKQPVIVENRPGGGNAIGAQAVASAAADGLTQFFQVASTTTPVFIKDFALDFMRDFDPVAPVWTVSYVMFINASVPAKNLKEFIDYAKANPGKLNYAAGTASTMLAMEMLKSRVGINLVPIPYKGSAPALTALVANEVQAAFDVAGLHKQHVDGGKERALYAADRQRSQVFPAVPTAAELGYPDLEVVLTGGFWTRTGAPRATVGRINAAVNEILALPEMVERFKSAGWFVLRGTPDDLKQRTKGEMDFWVKAARTANFQPE